MGRLTDWDLQSDFEVSLKWFRVSVLGGLWLWGKTKDCRV
jgi:hypothetical protein